MVSKWSANGLPMVRVSSSLRAAAAVHSPQNVADILSHRGYDRSYQRSIVMLGRERVSTSQASTRSWRRLSGLMAVMALGVALGGLVPSSAHAQKNINFFTSGSVNSTLVFGNQIVP